MNPWVRVLIIFFLGGLGVHKFVDKQTGMGILYLLTGGLFGIGWLVDLVKAIIAAVNSEDESTHASSTGEKRIRGENNRWSPCLRSRAATSRKL